MFKFTNFIIILMLIASLTGGTGYTQELIVFPAKGQSDEQMDKDKYDCYNWAKKETGFDPMQVPTASAPPPKTPESKASVGRGAVGGALLGTAVGALTGNAAKGAIIGTAGGAAVGGTRKNAAENKQEKATQEWADEQTTEYSQKRSKYDRAYSACLEGKGYTVK